MMGATFGFVRAFWRFVEARPRLTTCACVRMCIHLRPSVGVYAVAGWPARQEGMLGRDVNIGKSIYHRPCSGS